MRGDDTICGKLFSYIDLEKRIRADHPLRVIRAIANAALKSLSGEFQKLYSPLGRESIPIMGGVLDGDALQRHLALQLQNQLGLGSYGTAWMLCAKLRRAMVNPAREPLCGVVEADETVIPCRT